MTESDKAVVVDNGILKIERDEDRHFTIAFKRGDQEERMVRTPVGIRKLIDLLEIAYTAGFIAGVRTGPGQ